MEYKLKSIEIELLLKDEKASCIHLQDIRRLDENLRGDCATIYGQKKNSFQNEKDFIKRLKDGILNGFITDFKIGDTYQIAWFEIIDWFGIKEGVAVDHFDTLDYSETSEEFQKEIKKCQDMFETNKKGCQKKALLKRLQHACEGDDFDIATKALKKWYEINYARFEHENKNFIRNSLLNREIVTVENERTVAPRLFRTLSKYPKLFSRMPLACPRRLLKKKDRYSIIKTFLLFLYPALALTTLSGGFLIASLGFVFYAFFTQKIVSNLENRFFDGQKEESIKNLVKTLDSVYSLSFQKEKTDQNRRKKKRSFVDFIDYDLEYLGTKEAIGIAKSGFRDKLESLATDYSVERHEQFKTGACHDTCNAMRYRYMLKLLDLEIEIYSKNPRFGLVHKSTYKPTIAYFYSMMEYLDWSKDTIMHHDFLYFDLMQSFSEIAEMYYEGYEVEMRELFKLALAYARHVEVGDPFLEGFTEELNEKRKEIVDAATYKFNEAKRLEEECDDALRIEREKEDEIYANIQRALAKEEAKRIEFKPVDKQ